MFLSSAYTCEASKALQQSGLFISPPASPPTLSSQNTIDNIMNSCRSLQSLIAMTTNPEAGNPLAPAPAFATLPTPPMAHAPSPMRLRLRSRNKPEVASEEKPITRRRVTKRAPPRGANKRRRVADDDLGRESDSDSCLNDSDSELESGVQTPPKQSQTKSQSTSTPKRARIAPEQLPLGLDRSDFHRIHNESAQELGKVGTDIQVEADGTEWSAEDDHVLVELILEKLKLSKADWQDCARSLGKDHHAVNRRWKSLVINGDVGVKTRGGRRAKLHSTWR